MTPYVMLANRGTTAGVAGSVAGRNRTERSILRSLQLASAGAMLALGGALVTGRSPRIPAAALVGATVLKSVLFRRYVRHLQFDARDLAALAALQPALDVAYSAGITKGLLQLAKPGERSIS